MDNESRSYLLLVDQEAEKEHIVQKIAKVRVKGLCDVWCERGGW